MKLILGALALAFAVPAAAQQGAHQPPAKQDCCEKMKAEGKECCCKDMAKKDQGKQGEAKPAPADGHAGHDGHMH